MSKIPTPLEAQVLWLHAMDMNAREIADKLKITTAIASTNLTNAKKKAIALGLRIFVNPPAVASVKESGMSVALTLAREAGLLHEIKT